MGVLFDNVIQSVIIIINHQPSTIIRSKRSEIFYNSLKRKNIE